ncbi:unnamed protein product [Rotaria sp. Silwood2]|nr:unnamed protein product [Rotaria sp. Silwood2]
MDTKFAWLTTEKGEKAILYNNYLYHLKRENKNTSSRYVCTFKSCSRSITLKNNVIIKSNDENPNHEPKLPENVQRRRENGTAGPVPVFQAWKSTLYSIRKTVLPPTPLSLSSIIIPEDMYFISTL